MAVAQLNLSRRALLGAAFAAPVLPKNMSAMRFRQLLLLPPVADAEDDHRVALHPVAQHIRRDDRHLAASAAGVAAAVGEVDQAVGELDQAAGEALRGGGVEGGDVVGDGVEVGDGFLGPEDAPQISRRSGGGARV